MNFLGKLAAAIITPILTALLEKIPGWIREYQANRRARQERETAARRIREQTEQAQTPEERDEAARSNHSRGI